MKYILAISIESDVYKNPNLEFRLNGRLLDIIDLYRNYPSEIRSIKKETIVYSWGLEPDESCTMDSGGPTMVDVLHSRKWVFFEIDDASLLEENKVEVTCENFTTNYNNGFISRMDKCRVLDVLFMPKDYFFDIAKIFQHCTNRNILADWMWSTPQRPLGLGQGWPMIPALQYSGVTTQTDAEIRQDHGLGADDEICDSLRYNGDVWLNQNRNISIIWDERLGLYRTCDILNQHGLDFSHILLKDFRQYCVKKHNLPDAEIENIIVPVPNHDLQPGLVVNAETTYLTIHAPVKILLDRFRENKYLYEDQ